MLIHSTRTSREVSHFSMATVKWRRAAMGNNKRSRRVCPLTLTVTILVPVYNYYVTTVATTTIDTTTATTTTTSVKKMATLLRHGSFANAFRNTSAMLAVNTTTARHDIIRHKISSKAKMQKFLVKMKTESIKISLAARGFLRSQKNYTPPKNTSERIDKICESQNISVLNDTEKLEDPILRFKLFVACEEEFQHSIPNSLLYTIENIADLKQYYMTSVDTTTPYEAFRKIELPNLHVIQNYHRFHPDTDTMFGGKTAFPKSSTLVTGLKYKKKYPGHKQDNPWLNEMMQI